jgi:D-glycero-D-manno-heptose 1,7-bisphosphate phosphatase
MERAVFFDRDGVINKVIYRNGCPCPPRSLEEFVLNDGMYQTARKLKDHGYRIIVISNQPDLARGEITTCILDQMTKRMREAIPIDDVYICPHDDHHECLCRKPKPGMLIQASKKWNINLSVSFLIGDTWKDMAAGKAAGCKTILLDARYNQGVQCDFRVESISKAVDIVVKTQN